MQEASRIARRLSALVDLGLERADPIPVTSEAIRVDRKHYKVTTNKPAMGTLVSVTALGRSRDAIEEAIGRSWREMDRLIAIFSRFEGASQLSYLNENGKVDGPPEFTEVVSQSLHYHRMSRGNFDISVEPLVDLFRQGFAGESHREPSAAEIKDALELVGSNRIALSGPEVSFDRSGMRITLDGIAKGYIVDAMSDTMRSLGIGNFLINAGGDIRAVGVKEGKRPWAVAVQDPAKGADFPDAIHLGGAAVATSGSYEVYFDRQRQFHHIVNSKTGESAHSCASVSVVAPNAMAADALATTVFAMEPGQGVSLVDGLPGCSCLIVDSQGAQLKSRRWKSATPLQGAE